MQPLLTPHLPENLYHSDDPYDRVMAVIAFVNTLTEDHLFKVDEVPAEAFEAYYVDYLSAQIANGGMSQFVYNSRWKGPVIIFVRSGLKHIGAKGHLQWVEAIDQELAELGEDGLQAYFESGYFGDNAVRDRLDAVMGNQGAAEQEDLTTLLHRWIGSWTDVVLVPASDWEVTAAGFRDLVPDYDRRLIEHQAAVEAARTPQERVALRAISLAKRTFAHWNAFDVWEVEDERASRFHATTEEGYCFAALFPNRVQVHLDEDADPILVVYLAEDPETRALLPPSPALALKQFLDQHQLVDGGGRPVWEVVDRLDADQCQALVDDATRLANEWMQAYNITIDQPHLDLFDAARPMIERLIEQNDDRVPQAAIERWRRVSQEAADDIRRSRNKQAFARPGPYSDETSSEIFVMGVAPDQVLEWFAGKVDEILPATDDRDPLARLGAEETVIHHHGDASMTYLGLEDTLSPWPSTAALAKEVSDRFGVKVQFMVNGQFDEVDS